VHDFVPPGIKGEVPEGLTDPPTYPGTEDPEPLGDGKTHGKSMGNAMKAMGIPCKVS